MEFLKQNMSRLMGVAAMLLVFGWVLSFFQEGAQESFADFGLKLTYFLVALLVVGIAALFVYNLTINKKLLVKTVVVVGLVSVLFGICYGASTDDLSTIKGGLSSYTQSSLKMVGGLVGMTWALIAIAGVASAASEILKTFKNG